MKKFSSYVLLTCSYLFLTIFLGTGAFAETRITVFPEVESFKPGSTFWIAIKVEQRGENVVLVTNSVTGEPGIQVVLDEGENVMKGQTLYPVSNALLDEAETFVIPWDFWILQEIKTGFDILPPDFRREELARVPPKFSGVVSLAHFVDGQWRFDKYPFEFTLPEGNGQVSKDNTLLFSEAKKLLPKNLPWPTLLKGDESYFELNIYLPPDQRELFKEVLIFPAEGRNAIFINDGTNLEVKENGIQIKSNNPSYYEFGKTFRAFLMVFEEPGTPIYYYLETPNIIDDPVA